MRTRTIAASASALAVAGAAVLAAAPAEAARAPHGTLTIYGKQTTTQTLDLGASGPTAGDVTTGSGALSLTSGGAAVGSFVYFAETVRVEMPGGVKTNLTTNHLTLPGGQLIASGLVAVPQGTPPTAPAPLIITGGRGKYAGANGTVLLTPGAQGQWTITISFGK